MSDKGVRWCTLSGRRTAAALGIALVLCILPVRVAQAQGITVDAPFNLSNTGTASLFATLTADRSGLVHVFWCEDVGGAEVTPGHMGGNPNTLMYSAWDGQAWSDPIDLYFVSQGQSLMSPQATVDGRGVLHLAWFEGGDRLKYSQAPVTQARSAQAWTWPEELDADAGAIEDGLAIVADGDRIIHLLYAGGSRFRVLGEPRTVNYLRSTDGGASWSDPVVLMQIPGPDRGASDVRLYLDDAGRLHASWVEWNAEGFGQAVYYARSLDHGETWEPVTVVDQRDAAKISGESFRDRIIVTGSDADRLFRFWISGFPADWFYQASADGGATWGAKTPLYTQLRGDQGPPTFARDSLGALHLLIGQRETGTEPLPRGIGLWHSIWRDNHWSYPEPVGPQDDRLFNPKAAIVRGNELVVIWWSHELGEVTAMLGKLRDVPASATTPWPVVTPAPTPTAAAAIATQPAPRAEATSTPVSRGLAGVPPPSAADSTFAPVLVPTAAALLLVGAVTLARILRMRSR